MIKWWYFSHYGVWAYTIADRTQVDEASFRSTQASLSAALKDNIRDKFGVDWTQTQYEDLSKPLHSGIAAMLKIAKHYGSTDIPQSVASQASYWASSYTINTWTDAIYVYTKASDAVANSNSNNNNSNKQISIAPYASYRAYSSFTFSDFSQSQVHYFYCIVHGCVLTAVLCPSGGCVSGCPLRTCIVSNE